MTHYDVFNGDADGLCSLHQLRLAKPLDSILVTGLKRDISLLHRVAAQKGDTVTVLDVSAAANHVDLVRLLEQGVLVEYWDHHHAGTLPTHPNLKTHIDLSADTCTGIIVDGTLGGRFRAWAVVAAFGDNMEIPARRLAASLQLSERAVEQLRELGQLLCYSAYGDDESDLIVSALALYEQMREFTDPFRFLAEAHVLERIRSQRDDDLDKAAALRPDFELPGATVFTLPEGAWSRRVRGELANLLANRSPCMAHAVLTPKGAEHYCVSIRAPLASPEGADLICRRFPTGGGRRAAAGINDLLRSDVPRLLEVLEQAYPSPAPTITRSPNDDSA
ncbi:MAG: acetyltransferase [Burkholderiaceae bacterium]|jgi:hypothetical protein